MNIPNLSTTTLDPDDDPEAWTLAGSKTYKHITATDTAPVITQINPINSTLSDQRDIHIRLTSWPKTKTESDQVLNNFSLILKAIRETNETSEFEIFDNHGKSRSARK